MRYEEVNTCQSCTNQCTDGQGCSSARGKLRNYNGIRFTSDGFDCALPVSIDSHSICSYRCSYCFADNTVQHLAARSKPIGQTNLGELERLFGGEPGNRRDLFRQALKYDDLKNGYPCPVQLGAICDPSDDIERQQGWFKEYIKLASKYNQPTRISTKGTVIAEDDYLRTFEANNPELFWVTYSIITSDDDMIRKIEPRAPTATERIAAMKRLHDIGVRVSLRMRPMLPHVSDRTKAHRYAYKDLIDMAVDAGAEAISYEVAFTPGALTDFVKKRWQIISDAVGIDLIKTYKQFGGHMACNRPSYMWTENIMHAVAEYAKEQGLVIGVSDPVWKQLGETGCCCGILPDDPVFGNWQKESCTNRLLEAKWGERTEITADDILAPWTFSSDLRGTVYPGVGPKARYKSLHATFADLLLKSWNDPSSQRSPVNYFQGALVPVRRDEKGNLVYVYKGLERQYHKDVHWST